MTTPASPSTPRRPALTPAQRAAAETVRAAIPAADAVVRRHLGFRSVADLVRRTAGHGYIPSCRLDLAPEQATVADIFDAAMAALGDPRRAIRWPGRAA